MGKGQLCLGNFTCSTAYPFDPEWVYGCATGTSCSGGQQFSNMPVCEPTSPIDGSVPSPTCGANPNAYDLWFTFYATGSTATISVIQNTSFVAAIQAFSGSDCGSLSEIGCAVAGGPSSGVQLNLTGLIAGQLYHFRVYGTANNPSQQTGKFCFCGTTGLTNIPLPVALHLQAEVQGTSCVLGWTATNGMEMDHFEVERSTDGTFFARIGSVAPQPSTPNRYVDAQLPSGTYYYRLQAVTVNGGTVRSSVVEITLENSQTFVLMGNPCQDDLEVMATEAFDGWLLDLQGRQLQVEHISIGRNHVDVRELGPGVYLFQNGIKGDVRRFVVMR